MNNNSGMPNLSATQVNQLLNLASKKMGVSPDDLKSQLQNGSLPQGLNTNTVSQYLNDPKKLEQLLSSDKAQKILRDLMNNGR